MKIRSVVNGKTVQLSSGGWGYSKAVANPVDDFSEIVPYDGARLKVLLERLVDRRGRLHWHEDGDRSSALMVPPADAPGSPVFVTVVGDEAVVTAGMGAMLFLSCAEEGDEDHVIEVVAAIIDGGATEYGIFDAEDVPFRTGLAIVGPFGEYTFDTSSAMLMRQLPAWPGG